MIQGIFQQYNVIRIITDSKREADVIFDYGVREGVGSEKFEKFTGYEPDSSGCMRRINGGYEIVLTFKNDYSAGTAITYLSGFIAALNSVDWK